MKKMLTGACLAALLLTAKAGTGKCADAQHNHTGNIAMDTHAAPDGKKPDWLVHGAPEPGNTDFEYRIISASASNPDTARNACLNRLITDLNRMLNVTVTDNLSTVSERRQSDGGFDETITTRFEYSSRVSGNPFTVYFEKKDEYMETVWKHGTPAYICHTLYAVPVRSDSSARFDRLTFTTRYGARGLWRSALVPGLGQIYKGSTAKGIAIMGGEAILAGGIIACESLRQSYRTKIKETHNINHIRTYANKAGTYENIRNIGVGAVVALYVYNLADAAIAPGRKRTIVNKTALVPAISADYAGVALAFRF